MSNEEKDLIEKLAEEYGFTPESIEATAFAKGGDNDE